MSFRVLCLHGQGVNAEIFRSQTADFRAVLPSNYEFTFIDGIESCEPAPGIAGIHAGPYRCWYDSPSTENVKRVHKYITHLMDSEGPFDAIMGFSQGAAVASSILLHHELEKPHLPPPFKAAIFMGSPIPFSHSIENGIDTRTYFGIRSVVMGRPGAPTKVPEHLITDPRYLRGSRRASQELAYYQMFYPTVDRVRISIPTGHIYGKKDKWREHSIELSRLCNEGNVERFEHIEGHEVPKGCSEEICDVVETVFSRAERHQ